jgi:hypothetical protein
MRSAHSLARGWPQARFAFDREIGCWPGHPDGSGLHTVYMAVFSPAQGGQRSS